MTQYKLISFNLCPYVQRSVITLHEKHVHFEIEYIDLANKPEWFLKISPLGKVPVLKTGDRVLFESAVINEYLDETTEGSMLPSNPLEKAYGRAWIELSSQLLVDVYRLMVAKDAATTQTQSEAAIAKLAKLEEQLPDPGPYFYGSELSLVDSATAPALQRLVWMENLDSELDFFSSTPKVKRWKDALLARDSVKRSTIEGIEDIFRDYLKKYESWVARSA